MMTYDEALEYIHGISWTFCKPGLDRIRTLCDGLGNPQDGLRFVHVAGTNGKGSFCSMLSSVLSAAGYRVGLYTSPFILRFNERMQVSGVPISDEKLAELTERVRPIAEAMTDRPTEFELITAIAFEYFRDAGVDLVILECGMGGRLDSTNIINNSLLSVITGIALDHTAFLGDTVEKIATEKAGIIKHGCPVLYGDTDGAVLSIIREKAMEAGSEVHTVDYARLNTRAADLDGSVLDFGGITELRLPLLGLYQPINCARVLSAVEILNDGGLEITEADIRRGLQAAKWPARFEIIDRDPLTIFDGAHNPEGISAAVKSIRHYFGTTGVVAVSGVLSDKDYEFIAGELAGVAKRVFTITPDSPRALSAEKYAECIRKNGAKATPTASVAEALDRAQEYAGANGLAVVCLGSLYTYGEVVKHLKK